MQPSVNNTCIETEFHKVTVATSAHTAKEKKHVLTVKPCEQQM